jgi:hypothetical protein
VSASKPVSRPPGSPRQVRVRLTQTPGGASGLIIEERFHHHPPGLAFARHTTWEATADKALQNIHDMEAIIVALMTGGES